MELNITRTTFDQAGFDAAILERWLDRNNDPVEFADVLVKGMIYECTIHKTTFVPNLGLGVDSESAEPCWECYEEFKIKV